VVQGFSQLRGIYQGKATAIIAVQAIQVPASDEKGGDGFSFVINVDRG